MDAHMLETYIFKFNFLKVYISETKLYIMLKSVQFMQYMNSN